MLNPLEALLLILRDIDLESLTGCIERIIELFPVQVIPFAIALLDQLRDSVLKILVEEGQKSGEAFGTCWTPIVDI